MAHRYACLVILLPALAVAQPQLPGMYPQDTITRLCAGDSTTQVLTYQDWEAYQTFDDLWDGPRDTTVCIDLAHVVGNYVQSYISTDQIDASRPVFVRWLSDSASAVPLSPNDEYALDAYSNATGGFDDSNTCPGGFCTGVQAAVRIPHWSGMGTDLRWYQSAYNGSSWFGTPLHLCIPTEYFDQNDLAEVIYSLKSATGNPGEDLRLYSPELADLGASGNLTLFTQEMLPQYQTGPSSYELNPYFFFANNFLAMYPDTTYPDINNIRYLELSPSPNTPDSQQVTLTLSPEIGFNFQPYTDLRGGLVTGSDTLRHSVNVINNGADLCLTYMWAEVVIGPGDQYTHQVGHVDFAGERSCMMFKPNATLEVAAGKVFHFGAGGRGMLALNAGCKVQLEANAELDMHGTLVLMAPANATRTEDLRMVLKEGAKLTFAPGSRIINASGFGQGMMLDILMDGGKLDLSGLSGADRLKVRVTELPATEAAPVQVLGNPVGKELRMEMAVRSNGTCAVHVLDAAGRNVSNATLQLVAGRNTIALPSGNWLPGTYLVELRGADYRQVVRVVKP
ncbi:MAG: T9SS type A sorting domain-containing protein [Flavobacteriales bacterium]|nr:T9SS type A sorting domain-containing protein [Flavobacteriales bacterium]